MASDGVALEHLYSLFHNLPYGLVLHNFHDQEPWVSSGCTTILLGDSRPLGSGWFGLCCFS